MTQGIYAITCTVTGEQYIGASTNIEQRWRGHIASLQQGKSHNKRLQEVWNTHIPDDFQFEILEEVADRNQLRERERFYLSERAKTMKNFNIQKSSNLSDAIELFPLPYLQSWRLKKFLSRAELAIAVGLAEITIAKLERGEISTKINTIARLAQALGIRREQLVEENPKKKSPSI